MDRTFDPLFTKTVNLARHNILLLTFINWQVSWPWQYNFPSKNIDRKSSRQLTYFVTVWSFSTIFPCEMDRKILESSQFARDNFHWPFVQGLDLFAIYTFD